MRVGIPTAGYRGAPTDDPVLPSLCDAISRLALSSSSVRKLRKIMSLVAVSISLLLTQAAVVVRGFLSAHEPRAEARGHRTHRLVGGELEASIGSQQWLRP